MMLSLLIILLTVIKTDGFIYGLRQPSVSTVGMSTDDTRDMLQELNRKFDYEGRLRSGGADHRCGYVCIVGAPNMGKSTLLNALLDEELCVATRRPQTTRQSLVLFTRFPQKSFHVARLCFESRM